MSNVITVRKPTKGNLPREPTFVYENIETKI